MSELKTALDIVGFKIPQWKVRHMIDEMERKRNIEQRGRLDFQEFQNLCYELKAQDVAQSFKTQLTKKDNLETLGGMSAASSEGTTHSVRHEEQVAFSDWINSHLKHDPDLSHLLAIDSEGKELYSKVKDGILLW